MVISDIGSTDDTALICNTNRPATTNKYGYTNSGGNWLAPDNTTVDNGGASVPGFRRNRGPMIVRLMRNTATDPPPEGLYHCAIEDYRSTPRRVYVGLYHSGRGKTRRCF